MTQETDPLAHLQEVAARIAGVELKEDSAVATAAERNAKLKEALEDTTGQRINELAQGIASEVNDTLARQSLTRMTLELRRDGEPVVRQLFNNG